MESLKDIGVMVLAILFSALIITLAGMLPPLFSLLMATVACAPSSVYAASIIREHPPTGGRIVGILMLCVFPLLGWIEFIRALRRRSKN